MKPGKSKADQQVERDMKEADAREAERQFDRDLAAVLDRQAEKNGIIGPFDTADELFAAMEKPKPSLWQRFIAWLGRVA